MAGKVRIMCRLLFNIDILYVDKSVMSSIQNVVDIVMINVQYVNCNRRMGDRALPAGRPTGASMAKRDPNVTARNKRIKEMKERLRSLLPKVLAETGIDSEASLNAKIGGKADEFIDLRNEVINSPEHYASLYLDGFKNSRSTTGYRTSFDEMYDLFNESKAAQEYMMIFLERSYLKHYDELSKKRPTI